MLYILYDPLLLTTKKRVSPPLSVLAIPEDPLC